MRREEMNERYRTFSELLVERLKNDRELADEFLKSTMEEYTEDMDKETLLLSLRHLVEAKGFSKLARESGLTRDAFYKSLSPRGNPKLDTVMAILKALKYTITLKPLKSG
jgi:probable addiction module antidote protein